MKTIDKILGYNQFTVYQIELLQKAGLYNGIGTGGIFFDELIDSVFKLLRQSNVFDSSKGMQLRSEIDQLAITHDLDTKLKIGFFRSNKRLSKGLFQLLHNFPLRYRILIRIVVFYITNCTKKAYNNYYNI